MFHLPSNTVSADTRQLYVNIAHLCCTNTSIQVFTDGSRTERGAGSAIVALMGSQQLASRRLTSPRVSTATDAEIVK